MVLKFLIPFALDKILAHCTQKWRSFNPRKMIVSHLLSFARRIVRVFRFSFQHHIANIGTGRVVLQLTGIFNEVSWFKFFTTVGHSGLFYGPL